MAFGWDDAFLIAMQAAGVISTIYQGNKNKDLIQMGKALENSAFETSLTAIRAEAATSSLEALTQLRKNIGTQIAINAARGVASGAGSAQTNINTAEANYSSDEQKRRMNLLVRENELRGAHVLSGIHTLTSETQMGQSLTDQIFNKLPISGLADKFTKPEKTTKPAVTKTTSTPKKAGFGLTPV